MEISIKKNVFDQLEEPLINKNKNRKDKVFIREEIPIRDSIFLVDKMKPIEYLYYKRKLSTNDRKVGIHMNADDVPNKYVRRDGDKTYLDLDFINVIIYIKP